MKLLKDSQMILKGQQGIAILMVISAVVLLTTIMMTFSFDFNVNKIKAYNIQDRGQAKMMAEAGLRFAMTRLRLYKEYFNYVESNEDLKDFVKPEVLNGLWNFPFVYPIPVNKKFNQVQKDAIKKFEKESLLDGQMKLVILNISNKMNLNLIRASIIQKALDEEKGDSDDKEEDEEFRPEKQLLDLLTKAIEKKVESDEIFEAKYGSTDTQMLTNIIKVNISDAESLESDGGASTDFSTAEITPKMAPFSSFHELYALPGWDDDLVQLIKGEYTTYGSLMIDLNKITDKLFKLIVPTATEQDIKDFFEYKNDPENPKFFNSLSDFKSYIVKVGVLMGDQEFDERMAKFQQAGIQFGPSPSLFKVISTGSFGRAIYTLTAYVALPAKPMYEKPETPEEEEEEEETFESENEKEEKEEITDPENEKESEEKKEEEKEKTQLLNPRILEIFVS